MSFQYFILVWLMGFFALLSLDLFLEAFVFECLKWNGTDKNDWFFILWWAIVVAWFLWGMKCLYEKHKANQQES